MLHKYPSQKSILQENIRDKIFCWHINCRNYKKGEKKNRNCGENCIRKGKLREFTEKENVYKDLKFLETENF